MAKGNKNEKTADLLKNALGTDPSKEDTRPPIAPLQEAKKESKQGRSRAFSPLVPTKRLTFILPKSTVEELRIAFAKSGLNTQSELVDKAILYYIENKRSKK